MMAWTFPASTVRSTPLRIALSSSSSLTCRFLISSISLSPLPGRGRAAFMRNVKCFGQPFDGTAFSGDGDGRAGGRHHQHVVDHLVVEIDADDGVAAK